MLTDIVTLVHGKYRHLSKQIKRSLLGLSIVAGVNLFSENASANSDILAHVTKQSNALVYEIQRGDTVSALAHFFYDTDSYNEAMELFVEDNSAFLRRDISKIYEHEKVTFSLEKLKEETRELFNNAVDDPFHIDHDAYRVQEGDSISQLARLWYGGHYDSYMKQFISENPQFRYRNVNLIRPGEILFHRKKAIEVEEHLFVHPVEADHYISSAYNPNRIHPISKQCIPHDAIDISAHGKSVPFVSFADGVVEYKGYDNKSGEFIQVDHSEQYGFKAVYAHAARGSLRHLAHGQLVNAGDQLGMIGATGSATGNHLHFSIRITDYDLFSQYFPNVPQEIYRAKTQEYTVDPKKVFAVASLDSKIDTIVAFDDVKKRREREQEAVRAISSHSDVARILYEATNPIAVLQEVVEKTVGKLYEKTGISVQLDSFNTEVQKVFNTLQDTYLENALEQYEDQLRNTTDFGTVEANKDRILKSKALPQLVRQGKLREGVRAVLTKAGIDNSLLNSYVSYVSSEVHDRYIVREAA